MIQPFFSGQFFYSRRRVEYDGTIAKVEPVTLSAIALRRPPIQNEFGKSQMYVGTLTYAQKFGGYPNRATREWFFNLANTPRESRGPKMEGLPYLGRVVGTVMTCGGLDCRASPTFQFSISRSPCENYTNDQSQAFVPVGWE